MQAQPSSDSARPEVRLENRQFLVNGRAFLVRGIHYGPWRPGTGPNKQYPYPKDDEIAADFELIRRTGANTVLMYDPPVDVLDLAQQHGLKVIYVFALDWHSVGGADQPAMTAQLVERVKPLCTKPALLAYLLGNEVGGDILQARGDAPIVAGLRELYTAIKAVDPEHPISHANWPPARHLDFGFLDFISFNVYPLWPPEVVALGFGRYIEAVLRPIAAGKPLLISEFGANTIEAGEEGQARLIRESWEQLLRAGAAGGIVFEFADEWWKNYNNPARPGDWWTRVPAPDDEVRHDDDPEETYGIVTADRTPKPALASVTAMFTERPARDTARTFGTAALSAMVVVAAGGWIWARRRHVRRMARVRRHRGQ
jgi:Glycosyl hydrolases family 2, TIM barrel domain